MHYIYVLGDPLLQGTCKIVVAAPKGSLHQRQKKKSNNETEADVALARVFVAHLEPRGPVNQ